MGGPGGFQVCARVSLYPGARGKLIFSYTWDGALLRFSPRMNENQEQSMCVLRTWELRILFAEAFGGTSRAFFLYDGGQPCLEGQRDCSWDSLCYDRAYRGYEHFL